MKVFVDQETGEEIKKGRRQRRVIFLLGLLNTGKPRH